MLVDVIAATSVATRVVADSLCISYADEQPEWRFTATARDREMLASSGLLADELSEFEGVVSFSIERNRT